jgi:hypothetical protein
MFKEFGPYPQRKAVIWLTSRSGRLTLWVCLDVAASTKILHLQGIEPEVDHFTDTANTIILLCEFSDFHGKEYEHGSLLECGTV